MFWSFYSYVFDSDALACYYQNLQFANFTIKVNSICGAGRNTRNLCPKFSSQGLALKTLSLRVAISKSQGPSSGILDVRVPVPGSWVSGSLVSGSQSSRIQGTRVPGPSVPSSRVSESRVSRSQGPGPRSQVLILDYVLLGRKTKAADQLFSL